MRQLLPEPATIDDTVLATVISAYEVIERPHEKRPWAAMVMISSMDGSAVLDGRAGTLGNEADKRAFAAMRYMSDAIVVGAETVRVENYGPPRSRPEVAEWRTAQGMQPNPTMVVVSASLNFAPNDRLFESQGPRPVVVTDNAADPDRVKATQEHADVIQLEVVTAEAILMALTEHGVGTVSLEGGPGLNSEFLSAGIVDEMQLSISPKMVGGQGPRIIRSMGPVEDDFTLVQLWDSENLLIGRYVRA